MKKTPVQTYKLGQVEAAIWENDGKNGSFHQVTFRRRYKDGDEWKDSSSYALAQLAQLIAVAIQAQVWMLSATSSVSEEEEAA